MAAPLVLFNSTPVTTRNSGPVEDISLENPPQIILPATTETYENQVTSQHNLPCNMSEHDYVKAIHHYLNNSDSSFATNKAQDSQDSQNAQDRQALEVIQIDSNDISRPQRTTYKNTTPFPIFKGRIAEKDGSIKDYYTLAKDAYDWLSRTEDLFQIKGVPSVTRVAEACINLVDEARDWYDRMKTEVPSFNKSSWSVFTKEFKDAYCSSDDEALRIHRIRAINIVQTSSVDQ